MLKRQNAKYSKTNPQRPKTFPFQFSILKFQFSPKTNHQRPKTPHLPPATLALKGTRLHFMSSILLDHKLSIFNSQISNFPKDQPPKTKDPHPIAKLPANHYLCALKFKIYDQSKGAICPKSHRTTAHRRREDCIVQLLIRKKTWRRFFSGKWKFRNPNTTSELIR